jgi:hypothetical protein
MTADRGHIRPARAPALLCTRDERAQRLLTSQNMLSSWLLACIALLSVSRASPLDLQGGYSTAPLPPSRDPFYKAPPNYKAAAPGAILRARRAPGNLTTVIGNCSAAYNILYRTTDSQYQPSWAVTTLFVPKSGSVASKSVGSAGSLLSYQIAYDSAELDASPSYALYQGEPDVSDDVSNALGSGWFVNVPDYEGPLAAFTAGVQSGHATIDSIRAALSSDLGPSSDTRIALWGYSGGSLASEWAAELQIQYAPELTISGAALGGLTPNITSVLHTVNGSMYVGLVPSGVLGLATQYPDFNKLLLQGLKPSGPFNKTGFLAAKDLDQVEASAFYNEQDIFEYFTDGAAFFDQPVIKHVLNTEGLMGYHGVPNMPLFVYKAINDTLSKIEDTDALVNNYCNYGTNILYQRNTVGGHEAESVNGDDRAFAWLSSLLDGTLNQESCLTQNVTIDIISLPY